MQIDPITAKVEAATSLGLLLNELLTNTSKYGKPRDGASQKISIILRKEQQRMTLVYQDNGPGFASLRDPLSYQSLGMQIMSSIAGQLDGSMSISNDGGAKATFDLGLPPS
jgi:two-component sensor histidine kinase